MELLLGTALLLDCSAFRTLAGSGVGAGALSVYGQSSPVAKALVRTKVHESFDIHGNRGPQLALNFVIIIDDLTDVVDFNLRQIVSFCAGIDIELCEDISGNGSAYSVNIGQSNFDPLTLR